MNIALQAGAVPIPFTPSPRISLGVEIEIQLLDPTTGDLCPSASRVLERVGERPDVKAELFESMLEITSGVCGSMRDVRTDLEAAKRAVEEACAPLGLVAACAGTHPFARMEDRRVFPAERYAFVVERNQWIARQLFVFGLHVHLGMRSGDHAIATMNGVLPWLAPLLALSASSPYLRGADTGLASSRVTVFESMPTAGTPPQSFECWRDFEEFYDRLATSGSIVSPKDLWWDVRPNATYGTLEVRICDVLPTITETLGIVALLRCLAESIDQKARVGQAPPPPSTWRLRENKWRAARWGTNADIIVDESGKTAPMREVIAALFDELTPYARRLECMDELEVARELAARGGSARRQRDARERTGSLFGVVDSLVEEWQTGEPQYQAC